MRARWASLALAVAAAGCAHDWDSITGAPDAGVVDAAIEDVVIEDAATEDAAIEDAATDDAAIDDVVTEDAAIEDAALEDVATMDAPIGVDLPTHPDAPLPDDALDGAIDGGAADASDIGVSMDARDVPTTPDVPVALDVPGVRDVADARDAPPVDATCASGFADCNGDPRDGCEASLQVSPNCGACGVICGAAAVCAREVGGAACMCATGLRHCAGACVDPTTSAGHCGRCGNACPAVINGAPVCRAAACTSVCSAGFAQLPNLDCAAFGGATSYDSTPSPCVANPLIGNCGCSTGFNAGGYVIQARTEAPESPVFSSVLTLCSVPALAAASEWGGSFLARTGGLPLASDCVRVNPYTLGCGCPAGFAQAQFLPVQIGPPNRALSLVLCSRAVDLPGSTRTYLGAYAVLLGGYLNPTTGTACLSPNVRTGACTCPSGAREVTVRSVGAGVPTVGIVTPNAPAMIHFCIR